MKIKIQKLLFETFDLVCIVGLVYAAYRVGWADAIHKDDKPRVVHRIGGEVIELELRPLSEITNQ